MKYLLILQITFAITVDGFSQVSNSLFSSYKNHDLLFKRLDLRGLLRGGNSINTLDFLYGLNASLGYSQFTNRKKLQSDYTAGININNSKQNRFDNELDNFLLIDLSVNDKIRYYPKNEFFYGYGYGILYSYAHSLVNFTNTLALEKFKVHNLNIQIPLSIGYGRKYPVYSVHKSKWIYSALQKNNSLKRNPTEEDIEQLSHLLDKNVYTRFFDYRHKTIQDLSKVDSLLNRQDIITSQNISYFTTLFDMYFYSSGSNRFRSNILEGGLSTQYYYHQLKQTSKLDTSEIDNSENSKSLNPLIFVEYQKFNPINLYWQFDYTIRGEYGFEPLLKKESQLTPTYNLISLEGIASLTYYPNTRSNLNINLSARYGNKYSSLPSTFNLIPQNYYFPINGVDLRNLFLLSSFPSYGFTTYKNSYLYTSLELNHYYYISPQFRVQTNFTLNYSEFNSFYGNDANKFTTDFEVSFYYALF